MATTSQGSGEEAHRHGPAVKSAGARYLFAVVSALVALGATVLLAPLTGDSPNYVLLVGAVAATVWYGGFGAAVATIVVGWGLALSVALGSELLTLETEDDLARWLVALGVGVSVVWVSYLMRRGHQRAATAATEAEASIVEIANLQELASALSAALTPADVTHALIERVPGLVGARGGALAFVEGDEIVVSDPEGVATQTHRPGMRLPLAASAPIARAAATGAPVIVADRATFEEEYPDGAALTAYAQGALAVPLRAGGSVIGSMSFLFDRAGMGEDAEAIARIAADLGGQALERSHLYELERQSRNALDRILQIAPRFHAETVEDVVFEICRGVRTTFESDFGVLWRVAGDTLELMGSDPPQTTLEYGATVSLADFPRLREAIDRLDVSFVPDVQASSYGTGNAFVRALGIRSSLRTPVTIAGRPELLLVTSWRSVVSEPDPSTIALARRFADQAGLALEQLQRRLAQAEAARRAEESRRLHEITAALSQATTAVEVSNLCLERALESVGAEAGLVVLTAPEGRVEFISTHGYSDEVLEIWSGHDLESDAPFARAIATGEAIWASTPEDVAAFAAAARIGDASWATIPLKSAAGVRGALHLAFRSPRTVGEDERRWLGSVVAQCALALERSRLFDEEQRLRRTSERLQSMTVALANALTRSDVARVVVDEVSGAAGATGAAVAVVGNERRLVRTLAWSGYPDDLVGPLLEVPLDAPTPGNRVISSRTSAFYASIDDIRRAFPDAVEELAALGHSSFLFVPLVAGRQAQGVVVTSWDEPYALSEEERRFVEALAGQAAQALDRATRFESEQAIAETLQRSVLPASLPRVPGVELAARYLPGTVELDVGGDWFDAVTLADGRLGLVVGDVVGKGVQAAASMGQLRNALRAFALDRTKPASTIERLNRLVEGGLETAFATVVYVVLDPIARVCRYTSAGHPPPLVVYPDGRVELLEGGRGLPLGTLADTEYVQDVVELPAGSLLLLYTDGLVERRARPIDEGLERLCEAAHGAPSEPDQFVEHVLERMVGREDRGDDIAMLAVRLLTLAPAPLELRVARDMQSLPLVRDALRAWLEGTPLAGFEARDVVLAGWEACANAIEHSKSATDDVVTVAAHVSDSTVTVVVEDSGRWVDPSERSDRGLGLRLMRETMSSVSIETGEHGTRVTLVRVPAAAERRDSEER